MKRRHFQGDDLDDDYLKGEHNYEPIVTAIVIVIFMAVAFWPKK